MQQITRREDLPLILNRQDLIGLEIGVDHGKFSHAMLSTGLFKNFYCVDDWNYIFTDVLNEDGSPHEMSCDKDYPYNMAKQLLSGFKNVELIRKKSEHAVNDFPDSFFDFIYIDGNHTYDNVIKDITLWYPKLKKGGLLCGDDYLDKIKEYEIIEGIKSVAVFGVKSAVDEFAQKNNLQVNSFLDRVHENIEYPNWYYEPDSKK